MACSVCGTKRYVPLCKQHRFRFCSRECLAESRRQDMLGNTYAAGAKPNKTAFKKGMTPWNKDVKGIHVSPATEFKKGRPNPKRVPVGTVCIRRRRRESTPRAFVKVAEPNKWIPRAVAVWCNKHGPLSRGHVVHHKDRDTLNDSIDNLELLTRSKHIEEHRHDLRNCSTAARRRRSASSPSLHKAG